MSSTPVHYQLEPLMNKVINIADQAYREKTNPIAPIREAFRDSEEAKALVAVLNDV